MPKTGTPRDRDFVTDRSASGLPHEGLILQCVAYAEHGANAVDGCQFWRVSAVCATVQPAGIDIVSDHMECCPSAFTRTAKVQSTLSSKFATSSYPYLKVSLSRPGRLRKNAPKQQARRKMMYHLIRTAQAIDGRLIANQFFRSLLA
jgi:hypothetical protein